SADEGGAGWIDDARRDAARIAPRSHSAGGPVLESVDRDAVGVDRGARDGAGAVVESRRGGHEEIGVPVVPLRREGQLPDQRRVTVPLLVEGFLGGEHRL